MDPETNDEVIEEEGDTKVTPPAEGGGNEPQDDDVTKQLEELKKQLEAAKSQSRKWEKRAKANTDDQVAELRAEIDQLKSAAQRTALVDKLSREMDVNRDILGKMTGDDEDTIRANATLLQNLTAQQTSAPAHPQVPDGGETHEPAVTREQIEAIKDPMKRVHAIATHRNLFE